MIVAGTRTDKPRNFGPAANAATDSITGASKVEGRGAWEQTPMRGTSQMKPEHGVISVGSIPFLEPALRRALFINPMLGSVLHLHQITFALSILTTPQSKAAQKDLIAALGVGQNVGDPLHDQMVRQGLVDPDPFDAV